MGSHQCGGENLGFTSSYFIRTRCPPQLRDGSSRLGWNENLSLFRKTKTHLLSISSVYLLSSEIKTFAASLSEGLTNSISTGMFEFSLALYQQKPRLHSRKYSIKRECQVRDCVSTKPTVKYHSWASFSLFAIDRPRCYSIFNTFSFCFSETCLLSFISLNLHKTQQNVWRARCIVEQFYSLLPPRNAWSHSLTCVITVSEGIGIRKAHWSGRLAFGINVKASLPRFFFFPHVSLPPERLEYKSKSHARSSLSDNHGCTFGFVISSTWVL